MLAPHPVHLPQTKRALHKLDASEPSGLPSRVSLSPMSQTSSQSHIDDLNAPLKVFSLASPPPVTSPKRSLFRLKRPSSSSAAQQSTYSPRMHHLAESIEHLPEAAPSRPPRNPARKSTALHRPTTASGAIENENTKSSRFQRARSSSITSQMQMQTPQSPLHGFGPILSAGSDFVLQRRKSRSSKARPGRSNSIVQESFPPSPAHATTEQLEEEPGLQFSTTDRRILEELKCRMQAREAQFRIMHGKRHHPYRPEEVPYPCSYERRVLDNDIWECKWGQQTCGNLTWHTFDEPPQKVLDIGCGTGTWILDCAMQWKKTRFVGLDIVPLHADLQEVGSSQLASRITWVQANFLEGLPFPNEEFDFVHVKRIARAVPEDKWDALFEEILRIMKPGAAFQLLEEELTFPGKPVHPEPPEPVDLPTPSSSPWSSMSVFDVQSHPSHASSNTSLSSSPPRQLKPERPRMHTFVVPTLPMGMGLSVASPIVPVQAKLPLMRAHPLPHSHAPFARLHAHAHVEHGSAGNTRVAADAESDRGATSDFGFHEDERSALLPPPLTDPHDHSLLEYIYNEMHASRFINLEPLALLTNSLPLYFSDVRTHPPLILTFPPLPTTAQPVAAASDPVHSHKRASFVDPTEGRSGRYADEVREFEGRRGPKGWEYAVPGKDVLVLGPNFNSNSRAGLSGSGAERASGSGVDVTSRDTDTELESVTFAQLMHGSHQYVMLDDVRRTAVAPSASSRIVHAHPPARRRRSRSFSDFLFKRSSTATSSSSTVSPISTPSSTKPSSPVFSTSPSPSPSSSPSPRLRRTPSNPRLSTDFRLSAFTAALNLPAPSPSPYSTPSSTIGKTSSRRAAAAAAALRLLPSVRHMHFDVRTLNIHLTLRVHEILACTESMWSWVLARQKEIEHERAVRERVAREREREREILLEMGEVHGFGAAYAYTPSTARSRPHAGSKADGARPGHAAVLPSARASAEAKEAQFEEAVSTMTRQEFDQLLAYFEMDMQDSISLGSALHDRLGWQDNKKLAPNLRRKEFMQACEQWTALQQSSLSALQAYRPQAHDQQEHSGNALSPLRFTDGHSERRHTMAGVHPPAPLPEAAAPAPLPAVPPTERVSRIIRVFFAWKAEA